MTAFHTYITYGTNSTNVFAEAPPPAAPPYITIDKNIKIGQSQKNDLIYHMSMSLQFNMISKSTLRVHAYELSLLITYLRTTASHQQHMNHGSTPELLTTKRYSSYAKLTTLPSLLLMKRLKINYLLLHSHAYKSRSSS